MKLTILRQIKFATFLLLLAACAEKEFDPKDPKKSFGIAKEPYDDGYYDKAVQKLGEFKSRFPYSLYAAEAELLIGDAYYRSDKFPEAANAYEQFVRLHPKHVKADFAQFRVGESYWAAAPDDINRDQEYTEKAIAEWKKLQEKFPQSTYLKQAQELSAKGRRRLAESSQFAAHFYCKRSIFHACAYRYIKLLEVYPEFEDISQDALKELVRALEKVADAKEKDPESDKNIFFKTMTAEQIKQKAENFRKLIKS